MKTLERDGRSGGGKTRFSPVILIVDDQPMTLSALRRMFVREGYQVHTAANGPAALELLEQIECELVISDYLMPGMNGLELVRRIRERWPRVSCVMLTGCADLDIAAKGVRDRLLCKFVLKPWHGPDLKASVLEAILAGRERAAPGLAIGG